MSYGIMPLTFVVKRLVVINLAIWFVGVLILQNFFMDTPYLTQWFGFVPLRFFESFWVWQPLTYMFIHSVNVFHVLFNMILLWWLGSELENYWGRRYFLFYYLICGVGAALFYMLGAFIYYFISNNVMPLQVPVVGSSGAVFGLMFAYGLLFGERTVYFLGMFPMKARYFVLIIGGVEVMNLLASGFGSQVANLAHLGGLLTGFLLLSAGPRLQDLFRKTQSRAHGRRLKLVVDNVEQKKDGGPRYWN